MSLFSGDGTGASEKKQNVQKVIYTLQLLSSLLYSHIIVVVIIIIVIVS